MVAEFLNTTLEWFVCAVLTVFIIFHWKNLQSDLYTVERIVVDHLPMAPPLTDTYKRASYVTVFILISFAVSLFVDGFTAFWDSACIWLLLASFSIKQIGKTLMFYLFILRLRLSYKGTMFEYSDKKLTVTAWGLTFYSVVLVVVLIILVSGSSCDFDVNDPVVAIYALLIFLQDLVFTFIFMLMFVIPLRKLIKLCENDPSIGARREPEEPTQTANSQTAASETGNEEERDSGEHGGRKKVDNTAAGETQILWYAVVKTTILAVVAVISTIVLVLQWLATQVDLLQIDLLLNSICVLLMTPYYSDDIFYERLCCLCIRLCAPNIPAYKNSVTQYQEARSRSSRTHSKTSKTDNSVN